MNEERIRQIIESLDAEIAAAGNAKSCLTVGKPPNMLGLKANQAGLLKLSRKLLQMTSAPILEDRGCSKPVHATDEREQVLVEKDDRLLAWILRSEIWPESRDTPKDAIDKSSWRGVFSLLGCGIVVCILLAIFIAGIIAIWNAF